MGYRVTAGRFSGPFELLLTLVSRQKVDIGAISVSDIADQYLAEMDQLGDLDLEVASDFLLVAATLLEIKAASLVPDGRRAHQEVDDEDDPLEGLTAEQARDALVARLVAYKQFRNAGAALGDRMEAESHMHPRTAGPDPEFLGLMPDFLRSVTLSGLAVLCANLDSRRTQMLLDAEHVAPRRLPVALTVASVDRMTRARPTLTFDELLQGSRDPEQVVVTFLAVLELVKRGSVVVRQEEPFGTLDVARVAGAAAYELSEAAEAADFE